MADIINCPYLTTRYIFDLKTKFGNQLGTQTMYLPKVFGSSFIYSELSADPWTQKIVPILVLLSCHFDFFSWKKIFSANFRDIDHLNLKCLVYKLFFQKMARLGGIHLNVEGLRNHHYQSEHSFSWRNVKSWWIFQVNTKERLIVSFRPTVEEPSTHQNYLLKLM